MCVSLARVPPPLPPMAGSHEQAHEHARVLGSVPLSTFNSCVVPINPCPMSMFISSSSSFSLSLVARSIRPSSSSSSLLLSPLSPVPPYTPIMSSLERRRRRCRLLVRRLVQPKLDGEQVSARCVCVCGRMHAITHTPGVH